MAQIERGWYSDHKPGPLANDFRPGRPIHTGGTNRLRRTEPESARAADVSDLAAAGADSVERKPILSLSPSPSHGEGESGLFPDYKKTKPNKQYF